ncbi:hypothetical protein B0H14DRAFT_2558346 [Mycena olivaceomarginata]|nr:hypothetical protein B0H14DRAFT_2558346 [Mycena olivaceomarginata]
MAKVFGLASYTGRDKFCGERHDEINTHSRALLGPGNAGGKFRKAEAELCQKLPMGAVQHMVDTLNAGGKFCPFLATMLMDWLNEQGEIQFEWSEALPKAVTIEQRFEDKYPQLVSDSINTMYQWAKKGLQDYAAAREASPGQPAPVFPVSVEVLDDMSPNMVAQTMTDFLIKSYRAVFGDETQSIPWPAVAATPDRYYDAGKFDIVFSSSGLEGFKGTQWHLLGVALAVGAGDGSAGFFRKGSVLAGGEDALVQWKDDEEAEDARKAADEAEAAHKAADEAVDEEDAHKAAEAEDVHKAADEEDVRKQAEAEDAHKAVDEEDVRKVEAVEAARKQVEAAEAARKQAEAEDAHKAADEEDARKAGEAEDARKAVDEEDACKAVEVEDACKAVDEDACKAVEAEGRCKAKGRKSQKRKAPEDGLEADEEGAARRTARACKTPVEAAAECKKKIAAATDLKFGRELKFARAGLEFC